MDSEFVVASARHRFVPEVAGSMLVWVVAGMHVGLGRRHEGWSVVALRSL